MMEGIKLIRTNNQLKEKGSERMKGMNESHDNLEVLKGEIGEFKRKISESNKYPLNNRNTLGKRFDESEGCPMDDKIKCEEKSNEAYENNGLINSETNPNVTEIDSVTWEDIVLVGEKITEKIRNEIEEITGNEKIKCDANNPMGLLSIDPKARNKGWERYPGFKHLTTIIKNLARKIMAAKDSEETIDRHTCERIVMKMKYWRRYGESLCDTASLGRTQVKTVGRMILKDYNKFYSRMENMPRLNNDCAQLAKNLNLKWGPVSSREIKKSTELLRRVPDSKNYWNTIDTMQWSKTFMLTAMGCMTKQTQEYMRNNWSKGKIHQHTCVKNNVMMSNFRWKEIAGPRERFHGPPGEEKYERNFEGGILGNVPLLDKWSPWFLCIALHIHHTYRVLTREIRGIDIKHHGISQNNTG